MSSGAAQLGYGDGDEITVMSFGGNSSAKNITKYFRHHFVLVATSGLGPVQVALQVDDGAVVHLNGTEILRSNLPAGSITHTTQALTAIVGNAESTFYISFTPHHPKMPPK